MRVNRFASGCLVLTLGGSLYACGSKETTGSTGFMSTTTSTGSGGAGSGGEGGNGGLFSMTSSGTTGSTGTGTTSTGSTGSTGAGGMAPMCDPNPTMGPYTYASAYGNPAGKAGETRVGLAVAADGAGNMLIAGAFSASITFGAITLNGPGATNVFAAKLAPDGTPIWAKVFGSGTNVSARGVAVDPQGNIVLAGQFFGSVNFGGQSFQSVGPNFDDVFVAKLDPQGNHLWSKSFGDKDSQFANAVAVGPTGDIAVVGGFQSTLNFGAVSISNIVPLGMNQTLDAFVALFDSAGNVKWANRLGDTADQVVQSVAVDKNGNVLVTGYTQGGIDFGQGAQPLTGTQNAWAAKLSAAGSVTWGKLWGTQKASGHGIGADAAGNLFITGDHEGPIDFGGGALPNDFGPNVFVTKLSSMGAHVWSKSYGDDDSQHAKGLAVDGKGQVVVTGTIAGSMDFGKVKLTSLGSLDVFVAKIDSLGCAVWAKDFGNPMYQSSSATAVDAMGNVLVTGEISGLVNFGGMSSVDAQLDAAFLTKLGP
jgi:Beta-propeller repeat